LRLKCDPCQLFANNLNRAAWDEARDFVKMLRVGRHCQFRARRPLRAPAKKHLREKAATALRMFRVPRDGYQPPTE
jgi:hypothetical protein